MALDVRGSLKNTKISKNSYVVVDELLSNAIDSFLIRKEEDPNADPLMVDFLFELLEDDLLGEQLNLKLTCIDNGAGFNSARTKAFVTKDTSYKDDLGIAGIGQCKGSGRIQFLHFFKKIEIDSEYKENGDFKRRTLTVDQGTKEISESSFSLRNVEGSQYSTKLVLESLKDEIFEKIFQGKNLTSVFSVESIRHHILVSFLQRFISLKDSLGDFEISFRFIFKDNVQEAVLVPDDLPKITNSQTVKILYGDSVGVDQKSEVFSISHYKINEKDFDLKINRVAICAKSSVVEDVTGRYLKSKSLMNNAINGFYHVILIEGRYFDDSVNEQRDAFDIPKEKETASLISQKLSFEEIFDAIDSVVITMLSPPDWDKDEILIDIEKKFGISSSMINDAKIRLHYGDTEVSVVKRVMNVYQERVISSTSEILTIKDSILDLDPNADEYRDKLNELAWKYTSSLKDVDVMNLSQLVVRRAAVLEVLGSAISKGLATQSISGKRRNDESLIHQIFFPMRTDSQETNDHDIWILNEEYQYFEYIASDKLLSSISWNGSDLLFDSTIDQDMASALSENYESNKLKRPDLAIFPKEGAAIVVEFKSPDESLDEHIGDLKEYANLLAAKSGGKLKRVFGYLIGSKLNSNRLTGFRKFPSGRGWFGTFPITEPETDRAIGEMYAEILFYEDVVDRANKRLDVYRKRLNLI